ncbi:MAG TPA: TRAP transporter small permease [Burkholderiales bacterium]|nr:TRAP transporter small permease [Burkholderiales bacterium]
MLGTIAALDLAAMMLLTFFDVSGRKLFTAPIYGAYEVTEFMMGVLIFSALPLVTARENHVSIDVLDPYVPAALGRWQRVVVNLLSSVVLAFLGYRLWVLSASHLRTHEVTMTLHIPHGPFTFAFAVLALAAALAAFVVAAAHLRRARGRDPA